MITLQFETRQNLSRVQGKSSLSSDEFFGRKTSSNRGSNYNTPDLQDIKDGVRQGITKVAGRLSTITNSVVSSLQVRHNGNFDFIFFDYILS